MALFGPRLDRPSAVGDEGRPRATSLTVASVLTLLLFVVSTACPWTYRLSFEGGPVPTLVMPGCEGLGGLALGFATVTGLVTAGLALLGRDRLTTLFIGQIVFLPAGTALIAAVGAITVRSPSYGVFFLGFSLALVALGSTWTDSARAASARPALFQAGLTYLSIVGWGIVGSLLVAAVLVVRVLLASDDPGPTLALVAFLVLAFVGAVCFRLGLRWLPIRQLSSRRALPTVERRLGRLRRANTVVLVVTVAAVLVSLPTWFLGGFDLLYRLVPPLAAGFEVLATPVPVVAALGVGLVPFALGLGALALRRLTRPVDTTANRLLAPVLAGLFLVLGMAPFTFSLVPVLGSVSPLTVVLLILFGPIALYVTGWVLMGAQYLSLVPERAGGPALAAAGLVLATVGSALVGLPGPVVVATAAVAMIVWNVSAFGLGVTAELGHIPETRRLELFHALVALAVGAVTVVVLSVFDLLRTTVAGGLTVTAAAALAVLGVLVLLAPLRGYAVGEGGD